MQRKKWKFDFSHNISIREKIQFAKNIKRTKKTNEKINAKTTKIKIKHSIWLNESNDFDKSNDTYITNESIDFDICFDDDEKMQ